MPFPLPPPAIAAAKAHAIEAYPVEACGVVKDGAYVRCTNFATEKDAFVIAAQEWHDLQPVDALIHSHPDGPFSPSRRDMQTQVDQDIPWGIVVVGKAGPDDEIMAADPWFWGDMLPIVPLIMRDFRHGPSGTDGKGDCYALIRDCYRSPPAVVQAMIDKAAGRDRPAHATRNTAPIKPPAALWPLTAPVVLAEIPRDDAWWQAGSNLYLENFTRVGFQEIAKTLNGVEIGDVLLTRLISKVPNHGMIYLGDSLILHHKAGRASNIEPVHRWFPNISHVLRYGGPR